MIKFYQFLIAFGFVSISLFGQSPGDTIEVRTFNYQSVVRDTVIAFPNDPNLQFEKIIMLYNMRCKDGLVSTGADRNKGCGEWDYSCNTYVTDSNHVDSVNATHPSHTITGFTGNTYPYVTTPTANYYQQVEKNVVIDSTISETNATLGTGTKAMPFVLNTGTHAGKSQYLFTKDELITAGVDSGFIDALALQVSNAPQLAKMFRIRVKATADTVLNAATPDLSGFSEVYYKSTSFASGVNRFQFHTPFNWNGSSNLLVEFSFTNKVTNAGMIFSGDSLSAVNGIETSGEVRFDFDGSNHMVANNYKGVRGDTLRTVEAWINTTYSGKEIIGWGTNSTNQKYLVRIDGSGKLRVEVAGGYAIASTVISDGMWHHVAVVLTSANTSGAQFYIDGVPDNKSSVAQIAINTGNANNVGIGRFTNNNPWIGNIEEVRVWSKALSASEIKEWMYQSINSSHPSYANLELYYPFNEGSGSAIIDASGKGRNCTVQNSSNWTQYYGIDHFKRWNDSYKRPNVTFYQGVYNLTVANDTVLDTVVNTANVVKEYQVYSKAGTIYSDSLGVISQNNYWEAVNETIYSPSGGVASIIPLTATGTINITSLPYFNRNPSKFEIMSFVTPYGIGLDLGMDGETWAFDVTDYAPILKGNKRLNMDRGGQWQEDMDIRFLFIVGTPPRDIIDIQQIWRVDYKSYASISAEEFFEPRDVMMNPNGSFFKIRSMITGHGQEGEFIKRTHYVNLDGGAVDYSWQVWKECAFNPIYPQGGTWIYDRAGWCPGMATDLREFDITSKVTPGQTTEIDYGINTASGTSNYIVNHQLVTYGSANHTLDAAVSEIITPTSRIEYSRVGTICQGPVVRIVNTGSTTLTSLEIKYWVNNAPSPEVFNWTGSLDFMASEEVNLPVGNLWANLNGTSTNTFHVEVDLPNNGTDEYSFNNHVANDFEIPEVIPNEFYVRFRTNSVAYQNSYEVIDEWGNVVFSRNQFTNNTFHYDTLHLNDGCYTFKLYDSGHNGISFWANNEGSGQLQFRNANTNMIVKNFNGDFGGEINFPFTVNAPLSYEDLHPVTETKVYPNPASDRVILEMADLEKANVQFYSNTGQLLQLQSNRQGDTMWFNTTGLASGVYYIQIEKEGKVDYHKVVVL